MSSFSGVGRMNYLSPRLALTTSSRKHFFSSQIKLVVSFKVVSFKYVKNHAFDLANTHFIKKYSAREIEFYFIINTVGY